MFCSKNLYQLTRLMFNTNSIAGFDVVNEVFLMMVEVSYVGNSLIR